MATRKFDIVDVQWTDAYSVDEWANPLEFEAPDIVHTMGVIVRKEKDWLAVAGSFSCGNGEVGSDVATTMIIPRGMIKSIKKIRKVSCG